MDSSLSIVFSCRARLVDGLHYAQFSQPYSLCPGGGGTTRNQSGTEELPISVPLSCD